MVTFGGPGFSQNNPQIAESWMATSSRNFSTLFFCSNGHKTATEMTVHRVRSFNFTVTAEVFFVVFDAAVWAIGGEHSLLKPFPKRFSIWSVLNVEK